MQRETILITGCSSGIGKETATRLAAGGHRVVATAPSEALLEQCPSNATLRLVLDVTSAASVDAAIARAQAQVGPIGVLVNNAGFCQPGPIEQLSDEQIARQFDVNVFGMFRTTRAVLPAMRGARRGLIVNLSSVVGLVSFPFIGLYSASKHAVEGMSDALRIEVAPFGIEVVVIEPGWIRTGFAQTAIDLANRASLDHGQPYAAGLRAAEERQTHMRHIEGTPEQVAATIVRAIESEKRRERYRVTAVSKLFPALKAVLPTSAFDRLHRAIAGIGEAAP